MLFLLRAYIDKPDDVSNKEFYTVWRQESEAALAALKAGAIKGIWKAAGRPEVIAILDLPGADDLDQAILSLPIWKLGYSHFARRRNRPVAALRRLGRRPEETLTGIS